MELFDGFVGVAVRHDETQCDVGGAAGDHQDVDIFQRFEHSIGDTALIAELIADYRYDGNVGENAHLAKLFEVFENGVEVLPIVDCY